MGNGIFERTRDIGWQVLDINNGILVAERVFSEEIEKLDRILSETKINIVNHVIKRGGGQADQTLDLAAKLEGEEWLKENITIQNEISFSSGRETIVSDSTTHEIDHFVKGNSGGLAALEIEWNNKDEFYDRDFQAMRRLYEAHVVDLGIIITRGSELEECLESKVEEYFKQKSIGSIADFQRLVEYFTDENGKERFSFPTKPQEREILARAKNRSFAKASAQVFKKNKYGSTTTNWKQLERRISRKDAGRTPMIFLGMPPLFD